jgi:hypothetical protein
MTQPNADVPEETPVTEEAPKTFDQAQVDAIVKDRVARERQKFADYADLQKFKKESEAQRTATLTQAEQQIEAAREEGRQESKRANAEALAAAEIRAALTGVVDSPDDVLEDLNLAKYVGATGSVDTSAIEALKERYSKIVGRKTPTNVGHGRSTPAPAGQTEQEAFGAFLTKALNKT